MNINDPRAALVKGLHIEPESVTTSKELAPRNTLLPNVVTESGMTSSAIELAL